MWTNSSGSPDLPSIRALAFWQIHPLEPVGRARHLLSESIPDLQENEYALREASRLRDQYGDQIQIQLDLATWPAIHDHPEKIFADDGTPGADASLADLVAPLVLQTEASWLRFSTAFLAAGAWAI